MLPFLCVAHFLDIRDFHRITHLGLAYHELKSSHGVDRAKLTGPWSPKIIRSPTNGIEGDVGIIDDI